MYLITGVAGFIGSHIAEELIQDKNNVVIGIDNFYSGKRETVEYLNSIAHNNFIFIETDICSYSDLKRIFQTYPIEYIFHEAAITSVQLSIENPLLTHKVNVDGTLNILEAARTSNCIKKIVYASSAAVYGDEPSLPKNELSPLKPISPYGYEKLMGEQYLKLYANLYNLQCVSLRYFNVYGPRQNQDSDYSGVISIFEEKIKNSTPLIVYGDGEQYRDFIYVKDVVSANLTAMHSKTLPYDCYCVGTSQKTTINDLINIISQKDESASIIYLPSRDGDIKESLCDNTKLSYLMDCSTLQTLQSIFTLQEHE